MILSKVDLLLNECYPGENRDVQDPWYGGEDGYHPVYDMIEAACEAIVLRALTGKETQRIN